MTEEMKEEKKYTSSTRRRNLREKSSSDDVEDGRMFNAWADLERKAGNFESAKRILRDGMAVFPQDHSVCIDAFTIIRRYQDFLF